MGIFSEALYIENAFGRGSHVLTLLAVENSLIEVENILPDGFDYKGHLDNPSRVRWGEKELVADIYHSVGNELFFKGAYMEALRNYDKALYLNPRYEKARMNRLILLDKMGTEEIDENNAGL
jgi:tetratricopeptide (TPR) repeat protein